MGLPSCGIPEADLPQCWNDDVRMNALFAPFRIKAANPESWDMKMKFWSDMLRQWCRHRKDPIVSAADARTAFNRKGRTPACIDIVIEEMFRNGDLCPLSKYQQILHNGPEGWVKWGARLAFRPAAFALTAVASFMPNRQTVDNDGLPRASIDSTQRFVLESAVKEQATELLERFPEGVERMGTIEELMKSCQWSRARETFELLLGYLVAQGAAVKKGDVVKLAEPHQKASPVSSGDEALVKLMCAESRLEAEAQRLARDAAAAHQDARAALQLGNKLAAKNHLRRKHKTSARLDRCSNALESVRALLQQLREAHVNAAIVDTYRTTSDAMKRSMKENRLEEDAVHDTMDDLKEVMEQYNEVEKVLGTNLDEFDATELEDELHELLASDAPPGASPGKEERSSIGVKLPLPAGGESSFVFDGEARMLAELSRLDDDAPAEGRRQPVADTARAAEESAKSSKSQSWYPAAADSPRSQVWDTDNARVFHEIRQDDRLHPGQQLNVDFTKPPRLYSTDFQVRDHKMSGGVWLYSDSNSNSNVRGDSNSNVHSDLAASTEYYSSESPGKSAGAAAFKLAPGGERRKSDVTADVTGDLQRRLRDLRGFNL